MTIELIRKAKSIPKELKVGSTVRIKAFRRDEVPVFDMGWNNKMSAYCGKTARITNDDGFYYRLDIDCGVWKWEKGMFEGFDSPH